MTYQEVQEHIFGKENAWIGGYICWTLKEWFMLRDATKKVIDQICYHEFVHSADPDHFPMPHFLWNGIPIIFRPKPQRRADDTASIP